MILLSHPTGNAFVRALLNRLGQTAHDCMFFTTLAFSGNEWWWKGLPAKLKTNLSRRIYPVPADRIRRQPYREWVRVGLPGPLRRHFTRHESGWASVDGVYRSLDRHVARALGGEFVRNAVEGVYCYEDCAHETFGAAKARGAQCWYDLPIAYWETTRRLLEEEAARLPAWEPTLGGTRDSEEKLARKTRELDMADTVVCPSRFVLDSLPADTRKAKNCVVAEFGSPAPLEFPREAPGTAPGPLRVLFAGQLSQRKGLADVFEAMKRLRRSDVELVVMGSPQAPMEFYRREYPDFLYEAPRPHAQVLELMARCDVFVLPSIVEGRALVQQEALSCGLPLIITPNTGGDDLIDEGRTGFLVPARSPEAIAEKIAWFADHREALPEMSRSARDKSLEYSWERYADRILEATGLAPAEPACA